MDEVSCGHVNRRYTGVLYIDPMEHTWECPDCGFKGREVDEASRKDYNRRMKLGVYHVDNKREPEGGGDE